MQGRAEGREAVKRYKLLIGRLGSADCTRFDEVPDGEWVRWEDHEAFAENLSSLHGYCDDCGDEFWAPGHYCLRCGIERLEKRIADVRRAAFRDAREEYLKITRGNPLSFLTFEEWLTKQAEGSGE